MYLFNLGFWTLLWLHDWRQENNSHKYNKETTKMAIKKLHWREINSGGGQVSYSLK